MTVKTFHLNERRTVTLRAYLQDRMENVAFSAARPAVLILPGGAYEVISPREGEPIAAHFLAQGFNAFVLTYSTQKRHPQPLINAAWALANIRMRYKEYCIDPNKIAVCGFSAGGHLAATLSTKWNDPELGRYVNISPRLMRPDAAVLCYPVVSGLTRPHTRSFEVLLGSDPSRSELLALSAEHHVTPDTPPTFIWHTAEDDVVPAQNALVMAHACIKNHVPCELHVYDSGPHGAADCTKVTASSDFQINPHAARWVDEAMAFLRKYLRI